jgi:peptide/nickel transport system substrate-binding protein
VIVEFERAISVHVRKILHRAVIVVLGVAPLLSMGPGAAQEKTLRVVMHSDLRVLDPVLSSTYIVRNHGYMVYDTLFAMDEAFNIRPQMVESWRTSEATLVTTITLREGLTWHDGTMVTSEDCIASLKRWSARDPIGQKLAESLREYRAIDERTFEIVLREPFGALLEALAKPSGTVPFMMPRRVAETDPFQQISDPTGSGPFVPWPFSDMPRCPG